MNTHMVGQSVSTGMLTSMAITMGQWHPIMDPSMVTTVPMLPVTGMVTVGMDIIVDMDLDLIITILAAEDPSPQFASATVAAAAGRHLPGADLRGVMAISTGIIGTIIVMDHIALAIGASKVLATQATCSPSQQR